MWRNKNIVRNTIKIKIRQFGLLAIKTAVYLKIHPLSLFIYSDINHSKGRHSCPILGTGETLAGIQENTRFPRIKYGAGLVKPGMTNRIRLMSLCIV